MLSILLILFFANYIRVFADDLICGPNQRVVQCPSSCQSDYCPTREGESLFCLQPTECPPPACKCTLNYRFASNGNNTCIPTRQCPPFDCPGVNEVYNPCPPICPTDSCTQASPSGKCPSLGASNMLLVCIPSCRCKKDHWRDDNGTCVPYNKCPGKSQQDSDCENTDGGVDNELSPSNIFDGL